MLRCLKTHFPKRQLFSVMIIILCRIREKHLLLQAEPFALSIGNKEIYDFLLYPYIICTYRSTD